jgi:hypothetical protein
MIRIDPDFNSGNYSGLCRRDLYESLFGNWMQLGYDGLQISPDITLSECSGDTQAIGAPAYTLHVLWKPADLSGREVQISYSFSAERNGLCIEDICADPGGTGLIKPPLQAAIATALRIGAPEIRIHAMSHKGVSFWFFIGAVPDNWPPELESVAAPFLRETGLSSATQTRLQAILTEKQPASLRELAHLADGGRAIGKEILYALGRHLGRDRKNGIGHATLDLADPVARRYLGKYFGAPIMQPYACAIRPAIVRRAEPSPIEEAWF